MMLHPKVSPHGGTSVLPSHATYFGLPGALDAAHNVIPSTASRPVVLCEVILARIVNVKGALAATVVIVEAAAAKVS